MAGNRNSGMCSPLCSGVCAFYLPPRSYNKVMQNKALICALNTYEQPMN